VVLDVNLGESFVGRGAMFSIEVEEYGIIVRGEVPLMDLPAVAKLVEDRGFDVIDMDHSAFFKALRS